MSRNPLAILSITLAAAVPTLLSGCTAPNQGAGGEITGDELTIYSSLPLVGEDKKLGQDMLDGEKLALKESGGKINKWEINFVSRNDASEKTGLWTPLIVAENARKAAEDQTTLAYIGEGQPGASVISTPILNEAGILTVSPLDPYAGLTRAAGIEQGEPDKYYPTGKRTFGRVVPPSDVEAAAVIASVRKHKVKRLYIVGASDIYGRSIAETVARRAKQAKIPIKVALKQSGFDTKKLAQKIVSSKAQAVFFGGLSGEESAELWQALHKKGPNLLLFAPSALAVPSFLEAIGSAADKTVVISPVMPLGRYGKKGKQFISDFKSEFGREPGAYAVLGYEAMSAVLDSIKKAGKKGNDRDAVAEQLLKLRSADSPLGAYRFDAKGDSSRQNFYEFRVSDGRLTYVRSLPTATG